VPGRGHPTAGGSGATAVRSADENCRRGQRQGARRAPQVLALAGGSGVPPASEDGVPGSGDRTQNDPCHDPHGDVIERRTECSA
jgi:hypothetical protein